MTPKNKLDITTITVKRSTKITFDRIKVELQINSDELLMELLNKYKKENSNEK